MLTFRPPFHLAEIVLPEHPIAKALVRIQSDITQVKELPESEDSQERLRILRKAENGLQQLCLLDGVTVIRDSWTR